jgi:hypothetical protein
MDVIFDYIRVDTFWKILLFAHFLMAVGLLAAVTLQAASVLTSARQAAGSFIDRLSPIPAASYAGVIVLLYVPQALLGAVMYLKYRLYVRIPMEQLRHWWTLGAFEFKEHIIAMGIGLLPAYWYFWQEPYSTEDAGVRRWLTVFLAVTVWYAFVSGHVANDFRGIGAL